MEKLIGGNGRKPQISATAKMMCKSALKERFQETAKPHSKNARLVVPKLLRSYENPFELMEGSNDGFAVCEGLLGAMQR